jgi:hypothetical protein
VAAVTFEDIALAFDFVSSAAPMEHSAFISLDTGQIYGKSEFDSVDEVPSERTFDGQDIIRRALEKSCPLRLMLTNPEVGDRRAQQEHRDPGQIPADIRQSVRDLSNAGVPRDSIKYYGGSPTVFGLATSQHMLLNPYPYEQESHRCFTLIVRKTEYRKDIYHQYRKAHFDDPWEHAQTVPESDWTRLKAV